MQGAVLHLGRDLQDADEGHGALVSNVRCHQGGHGDARLQFPTGQRAVRVIMPPIRASVEPARNARSARNKVACLCGNRS